MDSCVPWEDLERYATGAASSNERSRIEAHVGTCDPCRLTLAAAGLAIRPGSAQEEALVAWMSSSRPVDALLADLGVRAAGSHPEPIPGRAEPARLLPFRMRSRAFVSGLAALAATLALFFVVPLDWNPRYPSRALEGRPSQLTAYAPYSSTRGSEEDEAWGDIEARSVRAGLLNETALLLARGSGGDWERAGEILREAPLSAARENDRGVLLLANGKTGAALEAFENALRLDAGLKAAYFNRALALDALGRKTEARQAWEEYLRRAPDDDDGWREEARERMAR